MNPYKEIIEKILLEVDDDIRELMMKESNQLDRENKPYKGYDFLQDPVNTILRWQELRDRNK